MLTFRFFLYLAAIAAAWLFRLAYIGWIGRYLLAFTAALPPLLLLLSLSAMRGMRLSLSALERCVIGSETCLRLDFSTRRLLPVSKITVTLEIENCFTGETEKASYIFRGMRNQYAELPLPTASCGRLRCRKADVRDHGRGIR